VEDGRSFPQIETLFAGREQHLIFPFSKSRHFSPDVVATSEHKEECDAADR
jgi:hypothetical protein